MKAIFIACDQALYVEVSQLMKDLGVRGYTSWEEVLGCGTETGEPHLGDAVWPMMNSAILSITDEERCSKLLAALRELDAATQSSVCGHSGGRSAVRFNARALKHGECYPPPKSPSCEGDFKAGNNNFLWIK